jgi:hypothetical protein
MDDCHLRDLMHAVIEPPASTAATEPSLIKMGFPCHAGSTMIWAVGSVTGFGDFSHVFFN